MVAPRQRLARRRTPDGDASNGGSEDVIGELRQVAIAEIEEPAQPVRRDFGDLAALADSMQEYGLQQPIAVRQEGGRLLLTSGLRRLTAARLLGWRTIPAFVR